MPEIKFKHLVSCSSEDKVHKAENLLKPELYRKWKCATPGEKRASVILQFEKASEIYSIDIGNESSAFVEVLVGKSSDTSNDYQSLLAASSFMSPLESRNETKSNRVRMFGPDKLAQNLKNEKWDCVQIVCTQPFNKNIQYGLSFIKFLSPPDPSQQSAAEAESKSSKLGAFSLKDDDDDNQISIGNLFKKRNENSNSVPVSGAAAIRQASAFAAAALASADDSASKILSTARPQIAGVKRKHLPDATVPSSSSPKQFTTTHVDKDKIEFKKVHEETQEKDKPSSSLKAVDAGEKTSGNPKAPKVKPFNKLLEKVVFVLSGFQNPFRSELRDKALEMGAKYKGDWDASCTHLVCAFVNTPKYSQVLKQKGRIVAKEWIIDCHKKKKHLPWRKYMLGKYSKDTTTEEEESEEESTQVNSRKETKTENKMVLSDTAGVKGTKERKETGNNKMPDSKANGALTRSVTEDTVISASEEEDYVADTEDDSSSGGDTEEEIRKVLEQQSKQKKLSKKHVEKSETSKKGEVIRAFLQGDSTDEDIDDGDDDSHNSAVNKTDTKDLPLPVLPDIFKGKHFFLYGVFSSEERHKLRRYIIGFNGSIEEYMGGNVKFVITNEKWDKNFDEALCENDNLIFVRPQWVFKCGQDCRFVPYQPYIVVPDT